MRSLCTCSGFCFYLWSSVNYHSWILKFSHLPWPGLAPLTSIGRVLVYYSCLIYPIPTILKVQNIEMWEQVNRWTGETWHSSVRRIHMSGILDQVFLPAGASDRSNWNDSINSEDHILKRTVQSYRVWACIPVNVEGTVQYIFEFYLDMDICKEEQQRLKGWGVVRWLLF